MIRTVARKELVDMTRDGRFRCAAGIVLALLLGAVVLGWRHYREVNAQHEMAQRATREQWLKQGVKNPHSAAHYGVYAFKPKLPLSLGDDAPRPVQDCITPNDVLAEKRHKGSRGARPEVGGGADATVA
jgi:ABC-2 type transport system permease protein